MPTPKVKICCISNIQEAQMAIAAGASALGLVGPMPSGPGIISNEEIAHIVTQIKNPVETFLLTSEITTDKIIAHHQQVNTTTIQIVDALKEGDYEDIRKALPNVKLVQVIHVLDEKTIEEARAIASQVDFILLDSGNPNLTIKELGGTGRTHNWDISRAIVEQITIPVFLAGGLNPSNVRKAIDHVQPFGVDLCSGVRVNGKLNREKLFHFMEEVG